MRSTFLTLLLLSPLLVSAGASHKKRQDTACGTYVVPKIAGGFKTRSFIDFSKAKTGDNTQQVLSENGLVISDWPITEPERISHTFTPNNVALVDGALNLKVSAYPGTGNVMSAEIATKAQLKFASVRTVQKSSKVAGVCEGNFFYRNDNAEVDLEILTSTISNSSKCVPAGIWATNQPLTTRAKPVSKTFPFGFDPTDDFHEYRIDWAANATLFYINGALQGEITQNVPKAAGQWMWNVWSNGDPCWSAGPPKADSITQIRSIEIYKSYTAQVTGKVCRV